MFRAVTLLPDTIHLTCDRCGRSGRYSRARYVALAGTEDAPSALLEFARAAGCEVALRQHEWEWSDRCQIVYDLPAGKRDQA